MEIPFKRVLILAPHTDDGEFGCGGTIARLIQHGAEVHYVAFSSAEQSLPPGMDKDTLKHEVRQAIQLLGMSQDNLILFPYKVRYFPENRQSILEDMVRLQRELQPDCVLLPSTMDTHQDHQTISSEGFRAFKQTTMLGYELPWNNLTFKTSAFTFIDENNLNKKINALKCYKSQAHRPYSNESFIRGLAVTRGTQIGAQYAEAFEVIRWIMH